MTPHTPYRWWTLGGAAWIAVVGCAEVPAPASIDPAGSNGAATTVASALQRAGDSATGVHGDAGDANWFYGAASVLRCHPVFDTVMIVVDGTPAMYDAVALAVGDTVGPHVAFTLFAWKPAGRRRIARFVVASGADIASGAPARLAYVVGRDSAWSGRVNSDQSSVMAVGQPCSAAADATGAVRLTDFELSTGGARALTGRAAGFILAFAGTVVSRADGSGGAIVERTHQVWMAPARVPGVYLTRAARVAGR